ncbi:MAG: AprI/Inh family metalloprotease inhibitor [Devosia sp.]
MTTWKRAGVSAAALGTLALVLAGCGTGRVATRNLGQPEQLQPIQDGTVASSNLPTIGQGGTAQTAQLDAPARPEQVNPALTGQPVLGGNQIGQPVQTANADGSFVTLDSVGAVPNAPGRDLSGGLTIEKLLGGWTIVSGAEQCKLNLTYTAKTGTSRYRASTPGCQLAGLKVVASWQLAGSQVQLFDENGDMIAALILSGNRFIGTLAGGQGISMVG